MKTKWKLMTGIFLITAVAFAASISDNTLNIGDRNSGTDKAIEMGAGRIKWDSTATKLQFSNDSGSNFKELGTGGGSGSGGINLYDADFNPDFEAGSPPSNWTASGGTFIADTATEGFGTQSGSMDFSGASQTLRGDLVDVPLGLENQNCSSSIWVKNASGASGDVKYRVLNSTSAVLAEMDVPVGANWQQLRLSFICPASNSIRIGFVAVVANPAIFLVDNAEIGSSSSFPVSQAALAGESYFPEFAGCTWTRTSGTLGAFGAVAACLGPVVTTQTIGEWQTTDSDLPRQTINNLPPGVYKATFRVGQSMNIAATSFLSIHDGTSSCQVPRVSGEHSSTASSGQVVSCVFTYTNAKTSVSFELHGGSSGNTLQIGNISGFVTQFTLEKYPLATDLAVRPDSIAQSWSGYFDSTCSFSNTGASLDDPAADASCALVERTNTNFGTVTAVAGILPQITVLPKRAGVYNVCASVGISSASTIVATIRLLVDSTVIADQVAWQQAGSPTGLSVCGLVNIADVSQKIFKVQSATTSGTVTIGSIGAATSGIEWTIYPVSQQFPAPLLVNSVVSKYAGVIGVESAHITNAGSPTVERELGDWISSVALNSTGDVTVNINSGVFSAAPNCVVVPESSTPNTACAIDTTSATTSTLVRTQCYVTTTSSAADTNFLVMCMGPR